MHFKIQKSKLIESLNQAIEAVDTRSSLEIMRGVLLVLSKNGLKIVGSDVSITVIRYVQPEDMEIIRLGSVIVPAKRFAEVIGLMPGGEVDIDMKGTMVKIKSGSAKVDISGYDSDLYSYQTGYSEDGVDIDSTILQSLIKRSIFAAAKEDKSMPVIEGARISIFEDRIVFTTTNRHRLAKVSAAATNNDVQEFVISSNHLQKITKIFPDEQSIRITFANNIATFTGPRAQVQTRVLEGTFPHVERSLPTDMPSSMIMDRNKLLESIKLVAAMAAQNQILFEVEGGGELKLRSKSQEGQTSDSVEIETFSGQPIRMVMNARYLLEALRAIEEEKVKVEYSKFNSAVLLGSGTDDDIFLVLPFNYNPEDWV